MELDALDKRLIAAIQGGFALVDKPFDSIAKQLGMTEQVVLDRLMQLKNDGIIKRLGVVVRHRELGFKANAMVVWDIPENRLDEIACHIASFDCVTLCYQRPRRLPDWSYNLFSMIHGKDRETVLQRLTDIVDALNIHNINYEPLFSTRRFKQRGARYINVDWQNSMQCPVNSLTNDRVINPIEMPKINSQDKRFSVMNRAYG